MSQQWRFKIELKDESTWERFEKITSFSAPEDLKKFIKDCNAASPEKNRIEINGNERVLDAVLSFNETEVEAATFGAAYKAIANHEIIPFARDPFGNFFCYSMKSGKIVFYYHEETQFENTGYSLKEFVEKLY